MSINIGDLLLKFFWGIIGFFTGLANFLSYEISLPNWFVNFLQENFPTFTIPGTISVWIILSTGGAGIAFAIGLYYIIKGAI